MVMCAVFKCKNRSERKEPGITFHRFPTDSERRNLWIRNMSISDWTPTPSERVCSEHFEARFFYQSGYKKRLLNGAVPTIFPEFPEHGNKLTESTSSRESASSRESTPTRESTPSRESSPSRDSTSSRESTWSGELTWSREEVITLIDLYRNYPVLYDANDPKYHSKQAQKQALENIVAKIKDVRPNSTVADIKTKINSLRAQFIKEIAVIKSQPSGTNICNISLWCFEQLLFLQDFIQSFQNTTMLEEDLAGSGGQLNDCDEFVLKFEEQNVSAMDSKCNTSTSGNKRKKGVKETNRSTINGQQNTSTSRCKRKKKERPDSIGPALGNRTNMPYKKQFDWDTFGQYVATELKSFKNPKRQILCKKRIMRLILSNKVEDMKD